MRYPLTDVVSRFFHDEGDPDERYLFVPAFRSRLIPEAFRCDVNL